MPITRDPKQYEELERLRTVWSESALQEAYAQARATKFVFTRRMLLRHTLLLGATGSGKTNHAFHLIKEALSGTGAAGGDASCLVIDVKKEYRKLRKILKGEVRVLALGDEPEVKFNPLSPPAGSRRTSGTGPSPTSSPGLTASLSLPGASSTTASPPSGRGRGTSPPRGSSR